MVFESRQQYTHDDRGVREFRKDWRRRVREERTKKIVTSKKKYRIMIKSREISNKNQKKQNKHERNEKKKITQMEFDLLVFG